MGNCKITSDALICKQNCPSKKDMAIPTTPKLMFAFSPIRIVKASVAKKRTVCPIATPRFDKELGLRSRNFRLAGVAVPHGGHNHRKHDSGDCDWNQHGQIHKLEPYAIQDDTYNGVDDDSA